MTDREIMQFIEQRFEDNLAVLETENQLRLNGYIKDQALKQVKLYWKKMKDTAQKVSETEVPLTLANQKTPSGRTFSIHGVVDIVQEDDETVLYDIKTHDPDFVRENTAVYEKQLNIYAKIWEGINSRRLDRTAIIATTLSPNLRSALKDHDADSAVVDSLLKEWNPLIPLSYSEQAAEETVREFAHTVDCIEDCAFSPVPLSRLQSKIENTNKTFAVNTCRSCDIRFCCDSYREYAYSRRRLSGDDLLHLMKEVGETRENDEFKAICFEDDLTKDFESSAAAEPESDSDTEETPEHDND